MNISIIQYCSESGSITSNTDKVNRLFQEIKKSKLVVLPELANTGYNFMKIYARFFVLLFFLSLLCQVVLAQPPEINAWHLAKNKNGIKIYTRTMEESKLKEFKAEIEIDISFQTLLNILMDVEHYKEWAENLKRAELLQVISDNDRIVYSQLKFPWPFCNRDVIGHSFTEWSASHDTVVTIIESLPDYLPKKRGVVRMRLARGRWEIYKINDNKVKVFYNYGADPGGNIPAWLVNMFIADAPYKTLMNLKSYIRQYTKNCE